MLLGVLLIILSTLFGVAVSTLLKMSLTLEERLFFSILVGHIASTMPVYLLSCWQKRLDLLSIVMGMVFIALASIFIIKGREILGGKSISKNFNLETIAVALAGTVAFLVLNLRCVLRKELNSVYSALFVHGDYSFHISVINSFVYRDNFPPQYPVMINTPMKYPILVDFLSSILMKTGFDLRSSIIIPNVLFQVSTLCLMASLAIRLVKRKYAGVLSALLFFFAGNMGIIYAVKDMANYGGFMKWMANLPTDYSGSSISSMPGMRFGNPVAVMLMPQRSSMLGIGVSLILYVLVLQTFQSRESARELMLAGILLGLLPSIHPHSFIAVSIILFFLALEFRMNLRFFAYLFVPAAVLSIPQVLAIQTQMGGEFMGFTIGWLGENAERIMALDWGTPLSIFFSIFVSISLLARFWLMNVGVIVLPLVFGLLRSERSIRRFYLPYLMLFFLGNFVRFQPWDWDNYKIFLHWYILTVITASCGIIEAARLSFKHLGLTGKLARSKRAYLRAILGVTTLTTILFFSTVTGFLSHIKMFQEGYVMWSEADGIFAGGIRENTPSESIFLTSTHYLHPAFTLAGRQIILGFEGWLWSHGMDWNHVQKMNRDAIEMFKGNYTLIKEYGVNFISITPYEEGFSADNNFRINIEFFNKSGFFEKVYDRTLNGNSYIIFKVL